MHTMTLDYLYESQKVIMSPHYWNNFNAEICRQTNILDLSSGHINGIFKYLNLKFIKKMLPKEMEMSGLFTGHINRSWNKIKKVQQYEIVLIGHNIKISKKNNGNVSFINCTMLMLNGKLDKNLLQVNLLIKTIHHGQFKSQIQVEDPQNRGLLFGNININNFSLKLLKNLISVNEDIISGNVNLVINMRGNMKRPELYGQLLLKNVVIKSNIQYVTMTKSKIVLLFSDIFSLLKKEMDIMQKIIQSINNYIHLSHIE